MASFFIRFTGLKCSLMEGRSDAGVTVLEPKNAEGLFALETVRVGAFEAGLGETAVAPAGVKVFAAGLGLNSRARTLNFVDGVWVGAGFCGLVMLG